MTIDEWIASATARLKASGVTSARLEAQLLAAHVQNVSRDRILTMGSDDINELAGESLLQRRERSEPLAYILGWREFFGRRFSVRSGVLIPRHETETLVELALSNLPQGASVLDLGTGSGCIGITLSLERPDLRVTLSDISEGALLIATENALDLGATVATKLSDRLLGFQNQTFDAIVSNPPYIGRHETLSSEVHDFEPHEALYAERSGLAFYEVIAGEAKGKTRLVFVEVGYEQANAVRLVFEAAGWAHLETRRDLIGHERALAFESQ